jgi:hypothetical protein
MKVKTIRALGGANVYSHQPVIITDLDLGNLKRKRNARNR